MDQSAPFNIFFWGVRGSHPVPGEHTQRYGGNTPCVEVRVGNQILIFDAGSGIIAMGQQLVRQAGEPIKASLFFSHLHHDHIQGLPFFTPLYLPASQLDF